MPTYYTRSHRDTDERCPRARWWNTGYRDRGIEATGDAYELSFGTLEHKVLAGLYQGMLLDDAIKEPLDQLRQCLTGADEQQLAEQLTLFEMLARGYHKTIYQHDVDDYDVVCVEREFEYPHDDLILGVKPDLILRRKIDGALVYREFKTTKATGTKYFGSFSRSAQLMAAMLAVEHGLGEPVGESQIQALYKGYDYKGTWNSPLVYLWTKPGQPGILEPQYSGGRPSSYKGWNKVPVWEFGLQQWLESIPMEELTEQFPQSEPIYVDRDMAENWIRQNAYREHQIILACKSLKDHELAGDPHTMVPFIMAADFPMHTAFCAPAFGYGCQFCDACWLPSVGADPIGSGLYRLREFHHEREKVEWEKEHGHHTP